ncbi:hypothetical protein HDV62DRAFT_143564 [Trichoderma sp. SZMC 28011]
MTLGFVIFLFLVISTFFSTTNIDNIMGDTSQSGHHAGWQYQEYQAESTDSSDMDTAINTESTGSSDTDPATNTNVSGGNPQRTTSLTPMAALMQESKRLANASLGRVPLPQSASNANTTIGTHGDANSPNPDDHLAMLNQYLERLRGPNTVLEESIQAFHRQLQRSNNNDNVTDMRQRFDGRFADLENRMNGVTQILQALNGQLKRPNNNDITDIRQRFDGRFADLENRINGVTERLQALDGRLQQLEHNNHGVEAPSPVDARLQQLDRRMANQTDAAVRLANRVSRTNQRLDQLERRAPEEDDDEYDDYWAQIEELIRGAVRDALHPTWAPPYGHDALAPPPYGPHPYSLQPLGVPPHVSHSPGMPPSGLIPNEAPSGIPLYIFDRAASRLVRLDAHEEATNEEATNEAPRGIPLYLFARAENRLVRLDAHEEATNEEATNEEATNEEAMDGVATNGNANDPPMVVMFRLDPRPIQRLPIRPPNSNTRHPNYRHPHLS